MTEIGPDISSFQAGLNVRALTNDYVLMKCTEDVGYTDADYPGWLAQAKATGKIVIPYHFIGPSDPAAQAAHLAAHIIDRSLPVMVDYEDEGSFRPSLAQLLALNDAIKASGLRVRLNYFPRWKWSEDGSPSLAGLPLRGIGVVSSDYLGGSGYPGDTGPGWAPYGGVTPSLWQYTDVAYEGGQSVGDMNAYKGSAAELAAFLGTTPTPTPSGGSTVSGTIPDSIASQDPDLPDIKTEFPAGQSFDNETAFIWTDERAAAANEHARLGLAATTALAQLVSADDSAAATHLQRITESLTSLTATVNTIGSAASTGGVDVPTLAVALAAALPAHVTLTVGAK